MSVCVCNGRTWYSVLYCFWRVCDSSSSSSFSTMSILPSFNVSFCFFLRVCIVNFCPFEKIDQIKTIEIRILERWKSNGKHAIRDNFDNRVNFAHPSVFCNMCIHFTYHILWNWNLKCVNMYWEISCVRSSPSICYFVFCFFSLLIIIAVKSYTFHIFHYVLIQTRTHAHDCTHISHMPTNHWNDAKIILWHSRTTKKKFSNIVH